MNLSGRFRSFVIMNTFWLLFAINIQALFSDSAIAANSGVDNYIFGVFPHLPPRELEKVYAPIAALIGDAIGVKVHLRSSSSYTIFMQNLDEAVFDIVFVHPFDYIRIADHLGYIPIASRGEPLSAIIVVGTGSDITQMQQLIGKKIALPPRVSAVSRLITGHLQKNNIHPGDDLSISNHRSHVSCLQQVLIGAADACGTAAPALRFFEHKMNVKMRTVSETLSIPHTLFAAHPRIPTHQISKIRSVILTLQHSEKGQKIMARGQLLPYKKIQNQDYDIVRELDKLTRH